MPIIFLLLESGRVDLVSSDVLSFEKAKNPYRERKIFIDMVLRNARFFQSINEKILERAQLLKTPEIEGIDALHLSYGGKAEVDYFITCDDKILKSN